MLHSLTERRSHSVWTTIIFWLQSSMLCAVLALARLWLCHVYMFRSPNLSMVRMTTGFPFRLAIAEAEECGFQGLHRPPHDGSLSSHPPAAAGVDTSPRYTCHLIVLCLSFHRGSAMPWSTEIKPSEEGDSKSCYNPSSRSYCHSVYTIDL